VLEKKRKKTSAETLKQEIQILIKNFQKARSVCRLLLRVVQSKEGS